MSHRSRSDSDVKHVFLRIMAHKPYENHRYFVSRIMNIVKMHVNYIHGWKDEIPFHFEVRLWGPLQRLSQTLDTHVLRESDRDVNNEGRDASQGDTESKLWIIHLSWDAAEHVTANRPNCAWNPRTKAHVCRRRLEMCHELKSGEKDENNLSGATKGFFFSCLYLITLTPNCKIQLQVYKL